MNLGQIKSKATEILGDVPGIFVDPADLVVGANWAVEVVARALQLTKKAVSNPFTASVSKQNALDMNKYLDVLMAGGTMLAKADLNFVNLRNPGWRNSSRPARYWFWINGNTIGIDGTPPASLQFVVLERPTAMVNDSDMPDVRLRDVDHMAFAHLAASYLVSLASSAQDAEKAKALFRKGMSLAGINDPTIEA